MVEPTTAKYRGCEGSRGAVAIRASHREAGGKRGSVCAANHGGCIRVHAGDDHAQL